MNEKVTNLSQYIAENFGANASYVEGLLNRYQSDPNLVDVIPRENVAKAKDVLIAAARCIVRKEQPLIPDRVRPVIIVPHKPQIFKQVRAAHLLISVAMRRAVIQTGRPTALDTVAGEDHRNAIGVEC